MFCLCLMCDSMRAADLILEEVEVLVEGEGVGAAVVRQAVLHRPLQLQAVADLPS